MDFAQQRAARGQVKSYKGPPICHSYFRTKGGGLSKADGGPAVKEGGFKENADVRKI